MKTSLIGEMIEDSIGERIENSMEKMNASSIEGRIEISMNLRVDHEILDLGQSSVGNAEPVNSGSNHELEGTAVITRIYPLKL